MKTTWIGVMTLAGLVAARTWAASIEDVTFLNRIQVYETVANTVLVTQEGKMMPLSTGTKVNVAGFTENDALVVSRSDQPNGFVRRTDLAPIMRSQSPEKPPRVKEETLPPSEKPEY